VIILYSNSVLIILSEPSADMEDDDDEDTVFSKSQQGKAIVFYEGWTFHFHIRNKDGSITPWRCADRFTSMCKGTLQTKDEKLLKHTDHVCDPHPFKIPKLKFLSDLKDVANSSTEVTSLIVGKELEKTEKKLRGR